MGYYTNYKLTSKPEATDEIRVDLENFIDNYQFYFDDKNDSIIPSDEIKWYDHDQDMKLFSKKYPNHIFYLVGIGEDTWHDIWRKTFQNGALIKEEKIKL